MKRDLEEAERGEGGARRGKTLDVAEARSRMDWLKEDEETARTVDGLLKPCGVWWLCWGKVWELLVEANLVWDGKSLVAAG